MPISTPTQITVPFATSGLKTSIPAASDPITGRAGYDQGFTAINMTPRTAGGIPPFGQDFNGIFFDISTALQFLEAGGGFPYNSAFATAVGGYPLGALVSRTDGSGLWRNTVANNTTDPEAFGAGWQPEDAGSAAVTMTNANVTLTALQAARAIITITGTLTANLNLIFPAYKMQWLVVNNCTGAFTITAKTAAGSGVSIAVGTSIIAYGDGANISAYQAPPSTTVGSTRNGKMAIAAASATGTYSADEVFVETYLGGPGYKLNAFSKPINLAATGVGGMDTGPAPASGFVGIYVIYNPISGISGMLAVNATAAAVPNIYGGVNMPAGFTASALVAIWNTTEASLFAIGVVDSDRRRAFFQRKASFAASGTAATLTSASIINFVPKNARSLFGDISGATTGGAAQSLTLSIAADAAGTAQIFPTQLQYVQVPYEIPLIVAQNCYYICSATGGTPSIQINVNGFTF